MKKCVVGIFFALVLCLAMLPMAAFAEDTVGAAQSSGCIRRQDRCCSKTGIRFRFER